MTPWERSILCARWLRSRGWQVVDLTESEELVARREGLDVGVVCAIGMRPSPEAARQLDEIERREGAASLSKCPPPSRPLHGNPTGGPNG